jgi:ketosteroid isomerase-like protein
VKQGIRSAVPSLGEGARRRTVDQRVSVRFPAVYRALAGLLQRLPVTSTARQRLLARQVAVAYAAANRRDFEAVLVGLDSLFEYRPSRDLMPPDVEPVFHGHDGYLDVWRHWQDAFGDIRWDPEELLDFGDRFLVTTQQRGTGSGSGVGVSEPVYQVFTLREGLVLRQDDFLDWSEALEAARGQAAA